MPANELAYTFATAFGLGTPVWNTIVSDSQVTQLAHRPRLVAVGGGVRLTLGGQLVGGFGISGGNALQDQQAAEIALRGPGFRRRLTRGPPKRQSAFSRSPPLGDPRSAAAP